MHIDDVSKENDYELYCHIQLYYEIFFKRQAVNFTKYFIFFQNPFIISCLYIVCTIISLKSTFRLP